jgi:hypothetical protein
MLRASDVGPTIRVSELAAGATTPASSAPTAVVSGLSTGPTVAQIKGAVSKVLVPGGKASRLKAILKAGGYKFSFAAPGGGRLVLSWFYAMKSKRKDQTVLVANVSGRVSRAGKLSLKIKLTAGGRKLLAHAKRIKLTAVGTFTPSGQHAVTVQKSFTLKT